MCGFVTIFDPEGRNDGSPQMIRTMCDLIEHRGPNHFGTYQDHHLAIGFRRLSIIDLSDNANQPMTKRDLVVVLNGEVYNYIEIRRELQREGILFETGSDTEVLLESYARWGSACLTRFNGMFAFLIWDRTKRALFVARDRLGVKPLFWAHEGGKIYFASDPKSLWEILLPSGRLNSRSILNFFHQGYINERETSVKGIQKFPPAHFLRIENGKETISRYWDLNGISGHAPITFDEVVQSTESTLRSALSLRLRSDVPVGCFLSGGVDSSLTTAMAAEQLGKFHTYSVGFDEKGSDESPFAYQVAARYGTEHHHIGLDHRCLEELPRIVWYYSELFGDSSAVPTYFVSKAAKEGLTVVLTGDGGDEAFGGYLDPYAVYLSQAYQRIPALLRRKVGDALAFLNSKLPAIPIRSLKRFNDLSLHSLEENYLQFKDGSWAPYPDLFSQNGYDHRVSLSRYLNDCQSDNPVTRLLYADIHDRLADDFLVKVDRGTMAHSLEARSPYLDYRLIEEGYQLPHSIRYHHLQRKAVLKKIAERYLGHELIYRRKMGFSIPQEKWLRQWWKTVKRIIDRPSSLDQFFDRPKLEPVLAEFENGRGDHTNRIWLLLWYQIWDGLFVSGVYHREQPLSKLAL